ncbi:MAG TPA: CoA transferase [Firmicutes bacterium]|nr:CoA transferase [Bacillota bacterium]
MESALSGIRVLELGQVVAAPFCGAMMADFGAEVIKVEAPGNGDSLRNMGPITKGESLWFHVENRNKKCITLNLKSYEGKELAKRLVSICDVVLENFKPGTLEKLGLGWEVIHQVNPRTVLCRISGYGQTGPYSNRYGYDRIGLGVGGLTYITGEPSGVPMRPGVALADYLAGIFATAGIMFALRYRDTFSGEGQVVDVSLYEPVFRIMEFTALDYWLNGRVRERMGTVHPGTVPGGHYRTADGKWICISCANDRVFERLAKAIDREELINDPRFSSHQKRVENRNEIEAIVAEWVAKHTAEECRIALQDTVPYGPINSIADIFSDPHFAARQDIVEVMDPLLGVLKMQAPTPKLSSTPGMVRSSGPRPGEHNDEVFGGILGLDKSRIRELREQGVI